MVMPTWQQGAELIKQGKPQEAEQALRTVVGADSLSFEGHYYLGAALAQQERWEDAAGALRSALEIEPDHVGAHYNLGVALERSDDLNGAIAEYQTALRLDPNHPKAQQRAQGAQAQLGARQQAAARRAAPAPGAWMAERDDEPVYTKEELAAADKQAMMEQYLVRGAVGITWGLGIALLFVAFFTTVGMFAAIIIVTPLLAPLIYFVLMDAHDWFSVNPKLAIPVSVIGIVFTIGVFIWASANDAFSW